MTVQHLVCPNRAMPDYPTVVVRGVLGIDRGYGFEFPEEFQLTPNELAEIAAIETKMMAEHFGPDFQLG